MSIKKQVMEIVPPEYNYSSEKDEFFGFMCPSCNGRGSHIDHYKGKEPVDIKCERCDGSGKLKAIVHTIWEADK